MTGEGEFFYFRSNFRAITRLETLATQAMHIQATPPLPYESVEEEENGPFFCIKWKLGKSPSPIWDSTDYPP